MPDDEVCDAYDALRNLMFSDTVISREYVDELMAMTTKDLVATLHAIAENMSLDIWSRGDRIMAANELFVLGFRLLDRQTHLPKTS
jgi:hypothetical protein